MVYFMAIDPEVTRRLREEVLEHCGLIDPPTFERIKGMKFSE
jgi:hypothetical protein